MEIKLTPQESEKYFYNALCNGLSYVESGYGLEIEAKQSDYLNAKNSLKGKMEENSICYEDIYMEILRMGNSLKIIDHEGSGEHTRSITLEDVHNRVQNTPLSHLNDMIQENDDAITADVIIQQVFFESIIFG